MTTEADKKVVNEDATDVEMMCEADGFPEPKIKWTKDGKDVTSDANQEGNKVCEKHLFRGCYKRKFSAAVFLRLNIFFKLNTET